MSAPFDFGQIVFKNLVGVKLGGFWNWDLVLTIGDKMYLNRNKTGIPGGMTETNVIRK